jgi:hypothetical protein
MQAQHMINVVHMTKMLSSIESLAVDAAYSAIACTQVDCHQLASTSQLCWPASRWEHNAAPDSLDWWLQRTP